MATCTMNLTCEMDMIGDAVRQIEEIHVRLATCHGDAFRALDRKIDAFMDDPSDGVEIHFLGGGMLVASPKGALTEIFRDARELGLIA